MRGFEGFVRRAVVIVPPDEDYKARTANREIEEGKEVPESAVLDMKGTLSLTLQPSSIILDFRCPFAPEFFFLLVSRPRFGGQF